MEWIISDFDLLIILAPFVSAAGYFVWPWPLNLWPQFDPLLCFYLCRHHLFRRHRGSFEQSERNRGLESLPMLLPNTYMWYDETVAIMPQTPTIFCYLLAFFQLCYSTVIYLGLWFALPLMVRGQLFYVYCCFCISLLSVVWLGWFSVDNLGQISILCYKWLIKDRCNSWSPNVKEITIVTDFAIVCCNNDKLLAWGGRAWYQYLEKKIPVYVRVMHQDCMLGQLFVNTETKKCL